MTDAVIEFAKWVIREGAFQAADLDGLSIQEKAHELGLINRTTYNPKKHGPSDCAEPGGEWFVFSPLLSALQPDESADQTGAHAVGEEGEEKKGREAVEDAVTWTGLLETLADSSFVSGSRAATLRAIAEHLRHSRPIEQAVTEAMVEAVVKAIRPYTRDTLFLDEHQILVRATLEAAREAGRQALASGESR